MEVKNKVLVTGSSGMVGSRFVELYKDKYTLLTPEIGKLDLTVRKAVRLYIEQNEPNVIVHFAAFTDVSAAEKERGNKKGLCWKVNVGATRNLVKAINPKITHFIHISTDMVFSGGKKDPGPYEEGHKLESDSDKLTWYGYTKKIAEDVVKKVLGRNCSILRLIYPVRAGFDKKLDPQVRGRLKLFDESKLYPLFDDQFLSITDVDEVCLALGKIIGQRAFGVFHASSKDTTTPYELGIYLIKKARGRENVVEKGFLDEYISKSGSSIRWPKYGGLRVKTTQARLGIKFSTWKQIVDKMVALGV